MCRHNHCFLIENVKHYPGKSKNVSDHDGLIRATIWLPHSFIASCATFEILFFCSRTKRFMLYAVFWEMPRSLRKKSLTQEKCIDQSFFFLEDIGVSKNCWRSNSSFRSLPVSRPDYRTCTHYDLSLNAVPYHFFVFISNSIVDAPGITNILLKKCGDKTMQKFSQTQIRDNRSLIFFDHYPNPAP